MIPFTLIDYDIMLVSAHTIIHVLSNSERPHSGEPGFEGRREATKEERPSTKYQCYGTTARQMEMLLKCSKIHSGHIGTLRHFEHNVH